MNPDALKTALLQWKRDLGSEAVLDCSESLQHVTTNCTAINRQILAILYPDCTEAVAQIVCTAVRHHIPLYPFSTGRNWGYGSINPPQDHCVLVDLSRMNKIITFDAKTGLLTIEPGVTQRLLKAYLKQHAHPFMIPVTGAGPDCSLMGNALERGYGITPYADHFGAVMAMQAVLPNGDIYQDSMMTLLGGQTVDHCFKWGMGPYIDGLFAQSNLGIVTQMTIALAPKPEQVTAFFFSVKKDESLELAVEKIRQVIREVGAVTGSINLMNLHRMLSMSEPYPQNQLNPQGLISHEALQEMGRRNQVMAWTGVGAIYGNKRVVSAVCKEVRHILKPVAKRLVFITPKQASWLKRTCDRLPYVRNSHWVKVFDTLDKTMKLFSGEPSEIALPLAYWRSGKMPQDGAPLNPDLDGCGLIWYSPLVPMKPAQVREYVEMVKNICIRYRIEPLITLTSFSDRCFDSTVPILFDRQNEEEIARAYRCYQELLATGRSKGFVPYRLGVQSMPMLSEENAVPEILKKIKIALDPDNIIAPGRYGL